MTHGYNIEVVYISPMFWILIFAQWHRSDAVGSSQGLRQASGEPPLLLRSQPKKATMASVLRDLIRQVCQVLVPKMTLLIRFCYSMDNVPEEHFLTGTTAEGSQFV